MESFLNSSVKDAVVERDRRGDKLIALDDVVTPIVEELREKGFTSPGLRQVVLSRVAPLPPKGKKLDATFDEAFDKAIAKAKAFDLASINLHDVAGGSFGGGGDD